MTLTEQVVSNRTYNPPQFSGSISSESMLLICRPSPSVPCWLSSRTRHSHVEVDILTSATSNQAIRASWWSNLPADLEPGPHLQARAFLSQMSPALATQTQREREAPKFFDLLACCVFAAGLQLVRLCSLAAGQSCLRVTLWQRPERVLVQQTWQPPGTVNSHLPY